MFRLTAAIVCGFLTWSIPNPSGREAQVQEDAELSPSVQVSARSLPGSLLSELDLPEAPPTNAYAITGSYLPPFLQAVVVAWRQEFPDISLTTNGLIFVIRPADFYSGLSVDEQHWLESREMLGIKNLPLIINPLTPHDDWYLRAQQEWKNGNNDAI